MALEIGIPQPDTSVVAGNKKSTAPENRITYPALDGIRALAFFMVFFQHYLLIPWGWAGVDLFFVLSGFLITGILYDARQDSHRVRNFYLRRTLRIFPLYYAIILVLILTKPFAHWNWSGIWAAWPAYLGNFARFVHPYQNGDPLQQMADFQPHGSFGHYNVALYLGHFWSLCVEEQFYLIWPWLVFWIRDRRKLCLLCAITVPVCLTMRLIGQALLPNWMLDNQILFRATPFRIDALLIGGFIALMIRGPLKRSLFQLARVAFPICIAMLILWVLLSPFGRIWRHAYSYPDWYFTWGLTAIDCLAGILILVAIQSGSLVYRIFNLRPLRALGRISYGLYVLHDIPHLVYVALAALVVKSLHQSVNEHLFILETRFLAAIVALIATVLMARLSYRFLESPFLSLKERWTIRD